MGPSRQRLVLGAIDRLFRSGTAAGLSDSQLLERFATRHGEAAEAAFAMLVERHGPMVLRVCRSVLGDPHDAQDAFQATFLILVQKPAAVRRRESLAGWLYGVAVRVAAHSRAASARRRVVESAARARDAAVPAATGDHQEVWEEVNRLPERYRLAVVLCYLEGLTHEQAAARLGWPVGTVRSRLARARARLRGRFLKRGLAPGCLAPLPHSLVEPTVKAAMLVAAHDAAEAGLVSASAAALTQGVLRTMLFAKLKSAVLAFVTVGAVAAGAGVYGYQDRVPDPRPEPAPVPAPPAPPGATDEEEDPVPKLPRAKPARPAPPAPPRRTARLAGTPTAYADQINELTARAREQQARGDVQGAAAATFRIVLLAGEWSQSLLGDRLPAPARPVTVPMTIEGDLNHLQAQGIARPRSDTERRLADVERKLERLLQRLDGDERPLPAPRALPPSPPAPPRAPAAPLAPAAPDAPELPRAPY
jgi:RNA polymerase sigma-70 factor (ECF subfamily)